MKPAGVAVVSFRVIGMLRPVCTPSSSNWLRSAIRAFAAGTKRCLDFSHTKKVSKISKSGLILSYNLFMILFCFWMF